MSLRLPSLSACVLGAALALSACGTTTYVSIRHPLQVGQVDPNQVPFEHTREERRRRLPPGTLVDQAQLVTLNPQQICVRVQVWSTQIEADRSIMENYQMVLVADNAGVENRPQQVNIEQPTMNVVRGVRGVYRGGYSSTRVPYTYQVTYQPATVCFANGGFVTPATTHLTLEMRGPRGGTNLNFEWDFASSVQ